jgi:short-subunit dehydrogenase
VLITGVSSGIGRAAVLAFCVAGYDVAGVARRAERLQELAAAVDQLPTPHGAFLPLVGDVTQRETMLQAVAQTQARFGRLDVLIANAGLGLRGAVAEAAWADVETVLRTNIDGVLHAIQAAVPALRQTGGGQIITISSVVANLISPYTATYAATKAFVTSLANSLRVELAADQIAVTDVLVGRTETEFNERRLGAGARSTSNLPTMSAEQVAAALVQAVAHRPPTLVLRFFDRLIVWGNRLIPRIMGELAKRQYK